MTKRKKSLAEGLKFLRLAKGDSLRGVEVATGISNAYLSQLERDAASNPTASVLFKLAKHYGVSYEELLTMAGHISDTSKSKGRNMSRTSIALKSASLSDEEDKEVANFVRFIVERRKEKI